MKIGDKIYFVGKVPHDFELLDFKNKGWEAIEGRVVSFDDEKAWIHGDEGSTHTDRMVLLPLRQIHATKEDAEASMRNIRQERG